MGGASHVSQAILAADELPVAIWLGEVPSGAVVYTNRAFREVLGIEPPEGAARNAFVEPYGVHTTDGRPYPEDAMPFERVLAARAQVVVDDLVIHRRDGRRVHLRVFAKPLFDEHGTMTHVLEAFTDITREIEADRARVEGEQRLARAHRLESIGQLAAGIAHDFNNLLTVTKLVAGSLRQSERDRQRAEMIGQIDAVTDSAIALVKNLLGFASRRRTFSVALALDEVVSSVVSLTARTFDRRVVIRTELAGDGASGSAPVVMGDASELAQVVMNLLVNARDAVTGEGTIIVRTYARAFEAGESGAPAAGAYAVLEVEDTGAGIEPSILERVFEPYFTTKTFGPVKGTGLGLATVHGVVQRHAGFAAVARSSAEGTLMRVGIPLASATERAGLVAASAPGRGEAGLPRGAGELVLVVDDEPFVRASASETIRSLGYDVLVAEDGKKGLDVFTAHSERIALVLLDMVMPEMNGKELFRAIRRTHPNTPIVLSTGCIDDRDARELAAEGAEEWLPKPYDVAQLAATLSRVVR